MAEQTASLELEHVKLRFSLQTGRFHIQVGEFLLSGLQAGFEFSEGVLAGEDLEWRLVEEQEKRLTVSGGGEELTLKLTFEVHSLEVNDSELPAMTVSTEVSSPGPFTLERIIVMQTDDALTAPERVFLLGARRSPSGAFLTREIEAFSSTPCCIWKNEESNLFFTFPVHQPLPSLVSGKVEGDTIRKFCIECSVELDEIEGSISAPPLTLCLSEHPHDFLEAYGDRQRTAEMRPIPRRPISWNSWDYILDLVSEDYMMKHLEFISRDPILSKSIEYIVVDCGWQHLHGEWEPNYRFPHGMEWLAKQIIDRGYKAGIWFCPTIFENCSIMAYWNDHLAAKGKSGYACKAWDCMRRYGLALDIMNPEARKWLYDLFARYRKMGYTYFKLDFLQHIANAYYYGGKRVPKGDLVREVINTIREAVGDESHIMGCNYPWESGISTIDSNRVSGDIRPRWNFIAKNARSIASRYWTHNRFWCSDPDFAILRGHETSDDPDLERMHNMNVYWEVDDTDITLPAMSMTASEAKTLLSIVLLSGGSVTLSDNLLKLNDVGLDLARKTVSAELGGAARPLDLFVSEYPSLWVQKLESGGMRIGRVNWSDDPVIETVDIRGLTGSDWRSVEEFWSGEKVSVSDGKAELQIPPHETKLLVLKDERT